MNINSLCDLFFPKRCDLCGEFVDTSGLCKDCWKKIRWISDPKCIICGLPFDTAVHSVCASCLKNKPYFDRAVSVFEYNDDFKKIIIGFKHYDSTNIAHRLAMWMYRSAEEYINVADVIVPVPIHFSKRLIRKYNQSEILAQIISGISFKIYEPRILVKSKKTRQQEGLTGDRRRRNVIGSFSINDMHIDAIKNKHVVLVDDVFTTGSTVNECSKILKKYGAKTVTVVTVAMVVV